MTRQECDAGIRAALEAMKFEGIDEMMRGLEALPFDDAYLDAVIAHLTSVLEHRLRVMHAEAQFWADGADEINRQAAACVAEFEHFRQLDITSTVQ